MERWALRHPELSISIDFLRNPFSTCSLYCSAIHQAVAGLDESIEAIVFANADTMPHPAWLRSLAAPLIDERVGAVTGNRWYVPTAGKMGSLIRYVQNASMVVVMHFLELTWGGSLSVKRAVFGHPKFLVELRSSSCEDQAIRRGLECAGLKVACSPAVMMVNTEECHVRSAYHFLRRQILWTRLYHPGWPSVLGQALSAAALIGVVILVFWTSVALGWWAVAGWLLSGSLVCLLANLLYLALLQRAVRRRVEQDQGQPMARFRRSVYPKFLAALPLALFAYLTATFSAAVARRVDWRGVSYQVVPLGGVRLLEYRKYLQPRCGGRRKTIPLAVPVCSTKRHACRRTLSEVCRPFGAAVGGQWATRRTDCQGHRTTGSHCVRETTARGNCSRRRYPRRNAAQEGLRHVWSDQLAAFYDENYSFLYGSIAWNRTPAKRAIRAWIAAYLARLGRQRVLAFGDGPGFDSLHLALSGHDVTYFDVSRFDSAFAREIFALSGVLPRIAARVDELEMGRYDAITCMDVLEHVPDPPQLVNLFSRLLRPGGRLIVSAPFFLVSEDFLTHLDSNRRYSGSLRLYRSDAFVLADGRLDWSPIVLTKPPVDPRSATCSPAWKLALRIAGLFFAGARISSAPYAWLARMATRSKSQWLEGLCAE